MHLKEELHRWQNDLLQPDSSDVLVNLKPDKNALILLDQKWQTTSSFSVSFSSFVGKLFKEYTKVKKETGIHIAGLSRGRIVFSFENKNYHCPLFIVNCRLVKNRIKENVEFTPVGEPFFNPFLEKVLQLSFEGLTFEEVLDKLEQEGLVFSFFDECYIANFNPQRFELVKELGSLVQQKSFNSTLNSLMNGEKEKEFELSLHEGDILSLDPDQKKAIESIRGGSLLVQGPPGTGKSHVISATLAKILGKEGAALVLAEKKVALNVVYEQLKLKRLHHFCLLYGSQVSKKEVVESLKESWLQLESFDYSDASFHKTTDLLLEQMNLVLDRLNEPNLIGGLSYAEFYKNCPDFSSVSYDYLGTLPDIIVWEQEKKIVKHLDEEELEQLTQVAFNLSLRKEGLNLEALQSDLKTIINLLEDSDYSGLTFEELTVKLKQSALTAHFFYDGNLLPKAILELDEKQLNLFRHNYTELVEKSEELELLEEEKENWSKSFNFTELMDYISALSSTNRFNIRERWKRNELRKYAKLDIKLAKKGLERLVRIKELERDILKLNKALRKQGLPINLAELHHINHLIKRLEQADAHDLQELNKLPVKELVRINHQSRNLRLIHLFFKHNFIELNTSGKLLLDYCKELECHLPLIARNVKYIEELSYATKQVLKNTKSIEKANELIYFKHLERFKGRYPELANYEAKIFEAKIQQFVQQQKIEHEAYANHLIGQQKKRFDAFHQLLATPAYKLKAEDKLLKQRLRKGKSLLVKNFGKSRNHSSLRTLLDSDARLWIDVLKPVFLMTPYSLAKHVPCDADLFDLLIIDEASQMPLSHAVGGVFRAKRAMVVGDEQQMAPSSFFKRKEEQVTTVLNQAQFYWDQVMLRYHYRSEHPLLMQFSNRYFYEGKLHVFPVPIIINPISLVTVNGCFEERKNSIEAENVARILSESIRKNEDVGLVAFSQAQLQEILSYLSSKELDFLEDKMVDALENVQGDQCDHLIISLGYGYNNEGKFYKRFGPLSVQQGSKRLNVLMSRARKHITFVRSVTSNDFSISSNEGAESLRKLMNYLEDVSEFNQQNDFSFFIKSYIVEDDCVVFKQFYKEEKDALKLITLYTTLTYKRWKVSFSLT